MATDSEYCLCCSVVAETTKNIVFVLLKKSIIKAITSINQFTVFEPRMWFKPFWSKLFQFFFFVFRYSDMLKNC